MFFGDSKPNEIENWSCIYECSTDYEAEMVKNYLADQQIPANILSKRDSAYSLNVGEMALVYVYVPSEFEERAREAIQKWEEADPNSDQRNQDSNQTS
ncbi:MAG: DUF2007 domain-containing protein [Bacteroidota bacterium]